MGRWWDRPGRGWGAARRSALPGRLRPDRGSGPRREPSCLHRGRGPSTARRIHGPGPDRHLHRRARLSFLHPLHRQVVGDPAAGGGAPGVVLGDGVRCGPRRSLAGSGGLGSSSGCWGWGLSPCLRLPWECSPSSYWPLRPLALPFSAGRSRSQRRLHAAREASPGASRPSASGCSRPCHSATPEPCPEPNAAPLGRPP